MRRRHDASVVASKAGSDIAEDEADKDDDVRNSLGVTHRTRAGRSADNLDTQTHAR
jgi:hypothetical protein